MTLCHYSDILQVAASLAGLSYDRTVGASGLEASEESTLRIGVGTVLGQLWGLARWPGLTRLQQRQFRATYAAGTAYTTGTFVYWPLTDDYYQALKSTTGNDPTDSSGVLNAAYWADAATSFSGANYSAGTTYAAGTIVKYLVNGNYYQCHTASTGNVPTNTSYWGLLVAFEPYIAFAQSGETIIDQQAEVQLWDLNPRLLSTARPIATLLTENGISPEPTSLYPARPWVEFKLACPILKGEVYVSTSAYVVGDQVQFAAASGAVETINFYDCVANAAAGDTPATDTDKWTRVEIPDYFKPLLGARAAMLFLTGDDDPKYAIAAQYAQDAEARLHDILYRIQGQVPESKIANYA